MDVDVQIQNKRKQLELIVADSVQCLNIFVLNWYDEFEAIQIFKVEENIHLKSICNEFSELFTNDLGLCKTMKGHIYIKSDARPKLFKPSPIPYASMESFKEEAEHLIALGLWKYIKYR